MKSITPALLRRMPLPWHDASSDKNSRGRILVIGGSPTVPGAILLAGVAALRSGAGKLQLATIRDAAIPLGMAVPEALVLGLPASPRGALHTARSLVLLRDYVMQCDATLVGPGLLQDRSVIPLVGGIMPALGADARLILDAAAIPAAKHADARTVITPHSGEMAALLDIDKDDVEANAPDVAVTAAQRFGCIVALKGSESFVATPDGEIYHYAGNSVGLATSGSGDTLAGVVAGLAARGADALTAAVWGVWAHGTAGKCLSRRVGRVGFLARELLAELPRLVG